MKKNKIVSILAIVGTLGAGAFLNASLQGCSGGDENCLVWGENCTQSYKQNTYGTTSIQCCTGQCTDHGSGIVTCGA